MTEPLEKELREAREGVQMAAIAVADAQEVFDVAAARLRRAKTYQASARKRYQAAVAALEAATPLPESDYKRQVRELNERWDQAEAERKEARDKAWREEGESLEQGEWGSRADEMPEVQGE